MNNSNSKTLQNKQKKVTLTKAVKFAPTSATSNATKKENSVKYNSNFTKQDAKLDKKPSSNSNTFKSDGTATAGKEKEKSVTSGVPSDANKTKEDVNGNDNVVNNDDLQGKSLSARKKIPKQPPKYNEFFCAVRDGNSKKVKLLIRKDKLDINWKDANDPLQPTALLIACENNDIEMVKTLVNPPTKQSIDVNIENTKGKRAIWWAAKHGNVEMVNQLCIYDCEVDVVDKETGTTPLFKGIVSNNGDICQQLIHGGADVNLRTLGFSGGAESPLMKAVQLDNLQVCEVLINSLCNIDAKTEEGLTALHFAVGYRRYDVAKCLLENRIKIHARTNNGATAMTIAIDQHSALMCRILIEYGFKMNRKYKWGETPLEHAIKLQSEDCAITLVYWGCNLKRKAGQISYFYMAAKEGLVQLMKLMVDINPFYLNEEWILVRDENSLPLSLYGMPEVYEWLFEASQQPPSLRKLCRMHIWKYLGQNPHTKVDKLPLPNKLKDFISLKQHIDEKAMYKKMPLSKDECPFDCPSYCSKPKCPELDFLYTDESSSESEEEKVEEQTTQEVKQEEPTPKKKRGRKLISH